MIVAKCGQGWTNNPCKHESTIQDCIQCICIHGYHARDCGMTPSETEKENVKSNN
jgi:hypothetical protein